MRDLSISKAWDETKAILARDGKLMVAVSLALVALPGVLTGLLTAGKMGTSDSPLWSDVVVLGASLVALAGQLALIRLALAPSLSVGDAIRHGFSRLPIFFLSALLLIVALFIIAIPFGIAAAMLGVPLESSATELTPTLALLLALFLILLFALFVRLMMSAPVASAEAVGPVAIIRRSWELTAGHWWKLLGFIAVLAVGILVLMLAIAAATGALVSLLVGPIEPMSASALIVALVQALLNAGFTVIFAVMLARIYVQLSGRASVGASSGT